MRASWVRGRFSSEGKSMHTFMKITSTTIKICLKTNVTPCIFILQINCKKKCKKGINYILSVHEFLFLSNIFMNGLFTKCLHLAKEKSSKIYENFAHFSVTWIPFKKKQQFLSRQKTFNYAKLTYLFWLINFYNRQSSFKNKS